ncbi:hypothetical protein BS47DRAFT_1449413 [Hydnum rufescens UP504]|uniref:Uncharacterized protein n=1 Tax=Hydnum rufescens UP504 TaxID=1448309 RepID=A0A9P6ADZ8_9AGAM|nr:hypothetical protein BS47DRAFT_1449413 [Hydnum rufescens UP504]
MLNHRRQLTCHHMKSYELKSSSSVQISVEQSCQVEALQDMNDVNNTQLALASFQVERTRHQLMHKEKKHKSSHRIKLATQVDRAEAARLEKVAQKKVQTARWAQGRRNAAAKGALASSRAALWEEAKKTNEAAEAHWRGEAQKCTEEGAWRRLSNRSGAEVHPIPKKPVAMKRKDVWAALDPPSGSQGAVGVTIESESSLDESSGGEGDA